MVVSSSATDFGLHLWPLLPNNDDTVEQQHQVVDGHQSHLVLHGHHKAINAVRFSKATSSLASCDGDGVIKLWSPFRR